MEFPLFATGVGLAAAVAYAVSCVVWPFAHCLVCDGTGRRARSDGKVWRTCKRCRGTGRRLRIGRRVWNYARRLHREAH